MVSRWRSSAILDFSKFEIFAVDRVHTVKMRHHVEFGEIGRTVAEIKADNGLVGQWVMNQMSQRIWMGYVGHESVPVTH